MLISGDGGGDGGASALAMLERARTELDGTRRGASPAERRAVVVVLADRLGLLARRSDCPVALGVLLHDWRDRLGSHVLVHDALGELELHPDLADQMLRRGVDELLGEAPARLAALDARRSVAQQP